VVRAGTGAQMDEALGASGFDLVLCGLNLPGLPGVASLRIARQHLPGVPSIALAESLEPAWVSECFQLGAVDYVLKVDLERLPLVIDRVMKRSDGEHRRRRMESRLQENEERLRQLAENINEVFWMTDAASGRFIYVSPAYESLWARTCASLINTPTQWIESIHEEDRERFVQESRAKENPGTYHLEYRIVRPDGSLRWIQDRAFPVRNTAGEIFRVAGLARDITDRKNAEAQLRDSQQFAKAALDALGAHVSVLDSQGTIIGANRSWREFSRLNSGGAGCLAEGANYLDICDRATGEFSCEAASVARGIRAVLRGELETFTQEYPCHAPHEKRWFLCRVTRFPGSGPTRVVVAHENVTAIKLVQEQLHESVDIFSSLARVAPVGIYRMDTQGACTYVNERWCALACISGEEALGNGWLAAVHPEDRARARDQWHDAARGGPPVRLEYRFQQPDGTLVWVAAKAAELTRSDGTVNGFVGAVFDITAEKAAKQDLETERSQLAERVVERTRELTLANTQLERASRMKNEFLANMSHELRTPLNAILGLSEALLEGRSSLTPRQARSLTTISSSGAHLLALINDILDLSKIEAGKLKLHAEPVNLPELCQSSLGFVRILAQRKRIDVVFEPEFDGVIEADPKRLKQILVNLLTNAVKFTPESGRIGLKLEAASPDESVRITVWDTGIGIATEDQERLFTAFTQIDSGLTRTQEGSGLGLALVRRLTHMHGGTVTLDSDPGRGSRFIVALPLWQTQPDPFEDGPGGKQRRISTGASSGEKTSRAGEETRKLQERRARARQLRDAGKPVAPPTSVRAVVVEDDSQVGGIILSHLNQLGLRGILLARGEDVLEAAVRERPDLIVMDIRLPKMDGWDVLGLLKKHSQTHDIPVVVVSGINNPEKARQLGAAAHLCKPFRFEQFAQLVRRVVGVPAAPAVQSPEPEPVRGAGPLILLAEDNEANIQTVGGYLEDKGYRLEYAANGRAAVRMTGTLRPALILMDVQMPVMDGLEAIRKIRENPALKEIPIVALTAMAMRGDRERCLNAGATDYMSKPVSLKELLARVERLTHGRHGNIETKPTR
jgi:PAS domain S-box-containing protein